DPDVHPREREDQLHGDDRRLPVARAPATPARPRAGRVRAALRARPARPVTPAGAPRDARAAREPAPGPSAFRGSGCARAAAGAAFVAYGVPVECPTGRHERPARAQHRRGRQGEIARATTRRELEDVRVRYLGKKGLLTQLLRSMPTLPPAERPVVGRE